MKMILQSAKKTPIKWPLRCMSTFVQDAPRHENPYVADAFLNRSLRRLLPQEVYNALHPDLVRFGDRTRRDIWKLGLQCEHEPPFLKHASAWGANGTELHTSAAWKTQKRIAAEEGLIAIAYEQDYGQYSRIYQTVKLMLYAPASGLYSCPLAMTDGAAHTLLSCDKSIPEVKEALDHLTSRSPDHFWTSGQWMTEKRGGSDVSQGTETVAVQAQDGWRLSGYKWFSSATDCDISLALARTEKGLSLFLVKLRDDKGALSRGLDIVKLKNKLGTRQLPTAELLLQDVRGVLLSDEGRGVAKISSMLTTTRLHNVISSVALVRKLLSLARDYSQRRMSFGKRIGQHPLHLSTLAQLEVDVRGSTALLLELARQSGLQDIGNIDEDGDGQLLRLMMPVAKMYTAKKAVSNISEGLECFGGQGYIEDTGLPGFLRDAQVLPIWEGTSNIMALDVLRALKNSKGKALSAFKTRVQGTIKESSKISDPCIVTASQAVKTALLGLMDFVSQNQSEPMIMEIAGRDLAMSLANIYIGCLLIDHALETQHALDASVARQFTIGRDLCPVDTVHKRSNGYRMQRESNAIQQLVFENYDAADAIDP